MGDRIRVLIVGAGGYGGCGSVEILSFHPKVDIVGLVDQQDIGKPYSEIYPHLKGFCDMEIVSPESCSSIGDVDVVFFSTPDGVGQVGARYWLEKGAKVIDFSGDFRFASPGEFQEYSKRIGKDPDHKAPDLLGQAVYGLPELYKDRIRGARLVGNPGCFAVSCILGLAPAVKEGLVELEGIVCDAKTGVSGAGKRPNPTFHYPARYEAINAYRIAGHQHVVEVEKNLSYLAKREIKITFTPHVVPISRGILSTIYGRLVKPLSSDDLVDVYRGFYRDSPFVRIFGPKSNQSSFYVRGSNFCNLWINTDPRTNMLIVVSHIDNLMKGQAGNAVQNMNIMFGLDETMGLLRPGQYP